MSDLISRQAAIDMIRLYREDEAVDLDELESSIAMMPSVQPEIIRCKDCTRYEKKSGRCNLVEGLNVATAESFCSYGEKK